MKTLLFVDDNKNIRLFCQMEFEEEGYLALVAADGREAIRIVQREHPDAVVLDLWMPTGHGLDALERIRAIDDKMPVILYTANDELCLRDPRSRLATACVEKSADLTELKQAVLRVLQAREHGSEFRLGLPPAPMPAQSQVLQNTAAAQAAQF